MEKIELPVVPRKVWLPSCRVILTHDARSHLSKPTWQYGVALHRMGYWGDVSKDVALRNDDNLRQQLAIYSLFGGPNDSKFWVITDAERSCHHIELAR